MCLYFAVFGKVEHWTFIRIAFICNNLLKELTLLLIKFKGIMNEKLKYLTLFVIGMMLSLGMNAQSVKSISGTVTDDQERRLSVVR